MLFYLGLRAWVNGGNRIGLAAGLRRGKTETTMNEEAETRPKPKSHHYVHRAYSEGFVHPNTSQNTEPRLWVYMPGKTPFRQRTERVAKRNYYYCLNEETGRDFQVEEALGKLEDAALPILRNLRGRNFSMVPDDRLTFAGYVALSFARVPTFEQSMNRISNLITARTLQAATQDESIMREAAEEHYKKTGERITAHEFRTKLTAGSVELQQTNRGWSIKIMFQTMLSLQLTIDKMHWSFLEAPADDHEFLTTDNPVSLYDLLIPQNGRVGFANKKAVTLAFPLSRSLCLIAGYAPMPISQKVDPARVRGINTGNIERCDRQLYAPLNPPKYRKSWMI